MKLAIQTLKKIIREEIDHLNESKKMPITPERLDKLLKIASTGPEGYRQAQELALMFDGVDQDKIDAAAAVDFETRKQMFALPYLQVPKAAIRVEIDETIKFIKNERAKENPSHQTIHEYEDYLDGLYEQLVDY